MVVIAQRGFLGRSMMLLALSTLIPEGMVQQARADERVRGVLLSAIHGFAPDLDVEATLALLLADVKAIAEAGPSHEQAAEYVAETFKQWANTGRRPVQVREQVVAGEWRAKVLFLSSGLYRAEAWRPATATDDGEFSIREATTRPEAWDLAVRDAQARDERDRACHLTGETESGPLTPMGTLSYDKFTAKYGIRDDLVKQPQTPEQRAKVQAWIQETLASRRPTPVNVGGWSPEDAADLQTQIVEHGLDKVTIEPVRGFPLPPPQETEFERGMRMAMNTSADRAMVGKTGPVDFAAAGEMNRLSLRRIYKPALEPVPPRPDWPPRYSKVPKPPRPAKSPEAKAEQRQSKAARTAKKSRRGYA